MAKEKVFYVYVRYVGGEDFTPIHDYKIPEDAFQLAATLLEDDDVAEVKVEKGFRDSDTGRMLDEVSYPVSKEKCSGCTSCCLVTKTISGEPLKRSEYYYQCLSDAEDVCGDKQENLSFEPERIP